MAKRGRKPRPETLKILDGTRSDRRNPDAPEPIRGHLECPEHLADDPVAQAEWVRMVALLDQMGVLSRTDGAALALYCVAFSCWVEARKSIKETGLIVQAARGGKKPNPAILIRNAASAEMAKLLVEFGCTPSSRGRLDRLKADAPPDEFEELLSSKPKRKA